MKELIIIGGGAAGITAGIFAARKYIDTTLITKDFTGQIGISAWIENYPGFKKISGLNLIQNFKKHLELFKIEIKPFEKIEKIEKIKSGFKIITDEKNYQTRSIIIASGGIPKRLKAKNENKFLGKGVSYCVTCDETAFKGKVVAVAGGGNAGVEGAIELSRIGKKVYIIECLDFLNADKILQAEAKKTGKIKIINSAEIKSFEGGTKLEKIIYLDKKSNKRKEMKVDGCFIEIGYNPNNEFVKNLVDLNKKGEIKVNPLTLQTSMAGVFAAGDVNNLKEKQVVIACGQGALAAISAYKYLNKK